MPDLQQKTGAAALRFLHASQYVIVIDGKSHKTNPFTDVSVGINSTTLAPQGSATRAQVAAMLQRYLEKSDH